MYTHFNINSIQQIYWAVSLQFGCTSNCLMKYPPEYTINTSKSNMPRMASFLQH